MTVLGSIWALLSASQRRGAMLMLCLMLIGMVLETLGVGLVLPALAAMTERDAPMRYPLLARLIVWMGNPDRERLVATGMVFLVGVYAVKAMFLAFLAWRQMKFVCGVQADLSYRLFAKYLRQPYVFHLHRNSAQLIRNALTETNLFAQTTLMAGLNLLTELLVVIGVITLLLVMEPLGALAVMAVLGSAGWGLHRLTHEGLLRWGQARQLHDGLCIQHLQQALGGAKDVKLLGREESFLEKYKLHAIGSARATRFVQTMQQMPRIAIELLAVSGLATLVLIMIGRQESLESLLPTLGLFAAAAFRLMPSANRLLGALQNVRYSLPAIDVLSHEFRAEEEVEQVRRSGRVGFERVLRLNRVTFRYPAAAEPTLRNVTLSVPCGACVGIIGESGAGKSTLIDVMLGLLRAEEGIVSVDDIDITENVRGWQDLIGYVPQSIFLTDDTLRRNVAFGLADDKIDEANVTRAVRAAQLDEFVSVLPDGLDTKVGERGVRLSGGQLQRVGIARALYHDPVVLVLDEATSALDSATERSVMDAVHALRGRKTVIIVAHRTSTVERCDRVFRIERGQILKEGPPALMLSNSLVPG
jgi:ATP-binding cassette, subfamily B, bacterial PglK